MLALSCPEKMPPKQIQLIAELLDDWVQDIKLETVIQLLSFLPLTWQKLIRRNDCGATCWEKPGAIGIPAPCSRMRQHVSAMQNSSIETAGLQKPP